MRGRGENSLKDIYKDEVRFETFLDWKNKERKSIVSSFAMPLIEESKLHSVCTMMSISVKWLVVVSPHKRPIISEAMGLT